MRDDMFAERITQRDGAAFRFFNVEELNETSSLPLRSELVRNHLFIKPKLLIVFVLHQTINSFFVPVANSGIYFLDLNFHFRSQLVNFFIGVRFLL